MTIQGDPVTTHPRPLRRLRRALAALAIGSLALASLAACGSDQAAAGADDTVTLRLGDPGNNGVLAYAKKTGILEKELAKVGAKVEWGGQYASFTATIDAVRAGDVNVLEGAISPAIGYLSTSDDLKIFAVADRTTDPKAPVGDGLVVPKGSSVRTLADLEGKKVAVNRGGRGEYLLLKALDQAGLPHDAVQRVYLNPQEAAGAFSAGQVDAWWAIVRGYPTALANGARTIVANTDVEDDDLTIFAARTEVVDANPKALETFQRVVAELVEQGNRDPEAFQNVFTDSGPTAVEGKALERDVAVQRYEVPFRLVTDADVAVVQKVADYFAENGLISKPVDAEKAVVQLGGSS